MNEEDNVIDFDPVRDYVQEQRRTVANAMQGLSDDPVKAARAQELSDATGVHPSLVYGNLENFEEQHKAQLVSQLVDSSDFLRRYVDEFPLASKISGNDYANLDTYGEKLKEFGDIPLYQKLAYGITRGLDTTFASTAEGVGVRGMQERFLEHTQKEMGVLPGSPTARDLEDWTRTIPGQVSGGAGSLLALAPALIAGGMPLAALQMGIMGGGNAEKRARENGADGPTRATAYAMGFVSNAALGMLPLGILKIPSQAIGPGISGWSATKLMQIGGFGSIFTVLGEMQHAADEYIAKTLHDPKAGYTPDANRILSTFILGGILGPSFNRVKPYVDAGVDVPVGIHPAVDKLKEIESKHDLDRYDEAFKAAQQSETREIAPGLFADAGRLQTDATIGIHIDAIEKMYGEKIPEVGDNKLGFIKNIADQIELARNTGGDVHVPLADWLAHVDPAIAKELHDDLRIRPQGLTKNEIKGLADVGKEEAPKEVDAEPTTPIDAVRSSADLEPLTERGKSPKEIFGGRFEEIGPELKILEPEKWHPDELKAIEAANAELEKLLPQGKVESRPARMISFEKKPASGVFQQYQEKVPTIVFLASPESAVGTVRHEAIHYLRREGFFTRDEWDTLKQAAHYNSWIEKHDIKARYEGRSASVMIEEAIAEEFKGWRQKPETVTLAGKVFQKLQDLSNKVVDAIQRALGAETAAHEIFKRIESGEIGSREGTKPLDQRAFSAAQEGGDFFSAIRNMMGKGRYDQYVKLIEKQNVEDLAYQTKKIEEVERARQSKEWKANEARVRDEVAHDVEGRPDIAATKFMTDYNFKFAADALTDEQKVVLPRSMVSKNGIKPDEVARMFGYQSGDMLIDRVASLNQMRGEMPFKEFVEKSIREETERRMQEKYGVAREEAMADAKDHVLGATQMDMLHEQTLALGMHAGLEGSTFTKANVLAALKAKFGAEYVSKVGADTYLTAAGRAGRLMEEAFLKDDMQEAFKQSQRQYYNTVLAKEARAFEKEQAQFDKTTTRLQKREVGGLPQEYTNFAHQILFDVGIGVKGRTLEDLKGEITAAGHTDLASFVAEKEGPMGLRIMPVADGLMDGSLHKPISEMTVDEFRAVKQSIDTLVKNGRDELKLIKAGDAMDLKSAIEQFNAKLKTFPFKEKPTSESFLNLPKTWLAASTNIETLLNRWDRNDKRGIFNQWIIRPLSEAANYKARLDREFSKEYRAIGKIEDGNKLVDSPLIDPRSGEPWKGFTKNNVMAMLQNAGNHSNWEKLAKGYDTDPKALWNWLLEHTTKEDWDRAQRMGDMFEKANKLSDEVYRRVSGVAPAKIDIQPIETPFGTYRGWYHPIMYDPVRANHLKANAAAMKGEGDYFRASTADGYTKRRTGFIDPLDLSFDMVPIRLAQMLHNIAFREVVINTQKVFDNGSFKKAVENHYGVHYRDLLEPYLKDVAGGAGVNSKALAQGAALSEYLRQNAISTYIGFNPYTVMKHGSTAWALSMKEVGPINFVNAVRSVFSTSAEIGLSNSEFAMKHSEELQRRERHWQDTVRGEHMLFTDKNTARENIIQWGAWAVAKSDMASAKPTWLAQYGQSIRDGMDHGAAVYEADRAVRRAHGSTAITNQPAIVRGGGALHGWLTSIYGFAGTMMQRQIEMWHQLNDSYKLGKEGEIKQATAAMVGAMTSFITYIVIPTAVEEMVTGLTTNDKRGWGAHLLTAAIHGLTFGTVYVRDLTHSAITGHDPGVGLISSALHDAANLFRDVKKGKQMINKENAGKLIGDALTVSGLAFGIAPKTIDNAMRFGIDLVNKQTKPKSVSDYALGVTRGTTKRREVK